MSWYYTRESGPSGEVLTDEGTPEGKVLSELLRDGPVPLRVGLELVAAMADILTIAEEDDAHHGDLKPGVVRIDGTGAVSIEGYGVTRRGGRAPEGRLLGAATDTYGLGVVLHAVLSSESLGAVPRERDAHDDHVVGRLLAIDWGDMSGKRWIDPVVHFLCSMLAHAPDERPAPLDVANILGEVADQVPGEDLVGWAARAVPPAGGAPGPRPAPSMLGDEELTGPQSLGRALSQTGAFSRRQAGRAKGECTAFWTREKIAAMLEESDSAAVSSPTPRARGGQRALPPPPVVPPVQPISGRTPSPPDVYPEGAPASPDVTITGQPTDEELQRVIASFKQREEDVPTDESPSGAHGVRAPAPPERFLGPDTDLPQLAPEPPLAPPGPPPVITQPSEEDLRPARPPIVRGPIAAKGRPGHTLQPETTRRLRYVSGPPVKTGPPPDRGPKRELPWLAIAIGVGGLALAFGLLVLASVVYYVKTADSEEVISDRSALVDSAAAAAAEEAKARHLEGKSKREDRRRDRTDRADRADRADRRERRERRKADRSAPAQRSTEAAAKAKAKQPRARARSTGSFVVQFKSPGAKARLECGDGQVVEFIGTTRRTFSSVTTCRVRIGDALGAVQVREPAVVKCVPEGTRVKCRRR